MSGPTATQPTLISALWTGTARQPMLRYAVLALAGTLLLTVSAKIQVPFWPVPMTMQTFAVLVIGMVYGPRLGAATVALYLLEGAFGLPVFAGAVAGPAYLVGPTGGYLAGFLVSAYVVGLLARRGWDRQLFSGLTAMVVGTAIIFAMGYAWLAGLIGVEAAFTAGVLPFLPGAALKIGLAAALLVASWRIVGRFRA